MIKSRLIYFGIITFFLFRCSNEENLSVSTDELKPYNIDVISSALNSLDSVKIKAVSTKEGYSSILNWSDSLRFNEIVLSISKNLNDKAVFEITTSSDSTVILSLGSSDVILGASKGYLFLEKKKGNWKIKKYRGGK